MVKIKNWTKHHEQMYTNNKSTTVVFIPRYQISHSGRRKYRYAVEIIGDFGWTSEHSILKTDLMTKQKAYDFAFDWMRNHPNG